MRDRTDRNIASPLAWELINIILGTYTSVSRNIEITVMKNERVVTNRVGKISSHLLKKTL